MSFTELIYNMAVLKTTLYENIIGHSHLDES